MLVDEPFLDDVFGFENGGVRGIDEENPAGLQRAPMVRKHARRVREMLDRVAGMDDVEAAGFEGCIFDARLDQLAAFDAGAGLGHALIRLHGDHVCMGRGFEKGAGETAAIGSHIEYLEPGREIDMVPQRRNGGIGAEAFAVTDIAPIGAARDGRLCSGRAVGAGQALEKSAVMTEVNSQSARRTIGAVNRL